MIEANLEKHHKQGARIEKHAIDIKESLNKITYLPQFSSNYSLNRGNAPDRNNSKELIEENRSLKEKIHQMQKTLAERDAALSAISHLAGGTNDEK